MNAWNSGARKYRVKHTFGGKTEYLRQSWGNYHKIGTTDVLESFWPDNDAYYPLVNPLEQYSIDQLLIQWSSLVDGPGIHEFQAEFFKTDGTSVPVPPHKLSIMVDNNMPEVRIDDILHNTNPVPPCAIENMTSLTDGVQAKITAWDPNGLLSDFALYAYYGAGQSDLIYSESYSNPNPIIHLPWQGVKSKIVPAGVYKPPLTCAYQFRLWAHPRLTNGWNSIGYAENTRHVTLIKPGATTPLISRFAAEYPLGITGSGEIVAKGIEPKKLGADTK
jgi:hypothetical protein